MTDEKPAAKPGPASGPNVRMRMLALVLAYVAAAALGLLLGRQGAFPFSLFLANEEAGSTSLTRVGFALQDDALAQTQPADWAALRADVDYVRATLNAQTNGVFDLVVAVRGLDNGGSPDWGKAEQLCHALNWPTCDRAALEELRNRSRP